MCLAIEEMRNDSKLEGEIKGKLEGEIKGTVETFKEVGFSLQETIQRISDKFNLSLHQAEEKTKNYWQ